MPEYPSPLLQPQLTSKKLTKFTLVQCRSIAWVSLGIVVLSITGAALIKVKQTISADGQLKLLETTTVMKLTPNTYIKEIYVEDGEQVDKGQPLLLFHSSDSQTELLLLEQRYQTLRQTNQLYQQVRQNYFSTAQIDSELEVLKLPEEVTFTIKNRTALVAANRVLQLQLEAQKKETNLTNQQLSNFNLRSFIQQLEEQINNQEIYLQDNNLQLEKEQKTLAEIKFLLEQGAVARVNYINQQQRIEKIKSQIEKANQQIQELHSQLKQARENSKISHKINPQNILKQIKENQQQVKIIDQEIENIEENNLEQIQQVNQQIKRIQETLNYQRLLSPVSGKVSAPLARTGFISPELLSQGVLQLVPQKEVLVAEFLVPSNQIDLISQEMEGEVKLHLPDLAAQPTVKGKVINTSSDLLPAAHQNLPSHFLVTVGLPEQFVVIDGQKINLKPGTLVTLKIEPIRQKSLLRIVFEQIFSSY